MSSLSSSSSLPVLSSSSSLPLLSSSLPWLSSLSSLFSESVVPPSLERTHWAGSSSEETSSSDEESSSPNARRFFDVAVDISSSFVSILVLVLLGSQLGLLRRMDSSVEFPVYMESPTSIPRGTHDCSVKSCRRAFLRGTHNYSCATLELLVAMSNDYVGIVRH
jgi:hypothetical protein